LRLTWRNREFYTKGATDTELLTGGDLAALQTLATGELAQRLA
jgi:hypothetical protein